MLRVIFAALLALISVPASALPNIIVIMTDDMRWDDIQTMPQLQNLLVKRGALFTNSFANYPLCCPSRASFVTGQAARNHGIRGNEPSTSGGELLFQAQEGNALPVWLQTKGYQTALVGKYLNFYGFATESTYDAASVTRIPAGWTNWQAMPDPLGTYSYCDYQVNNNGVLEDYTSASCANYQTDVLSRKATSIVAAQTQPFFLWVTPLAPHLGGGGDDPTFPTSPRAASRHAGKFSTLRLPFPPSFNQTDMSLMPAFMQTLSQFDTSTLAAINNIFRKRREALLAVDDLIASTVRAVKARGVENNTYIVFTSDNGWSYGEHRRSQGKQVLYDEVQRLPLIIVGPTVTAGTVISKIVNNLDVVATIVAWSGATALRTLDGVSLAPLLANPNASWRTAIQYEGSDAPLGGPHNDRFVGLRTPIYSYAEHTTGEVELYNMIRDPYQMNNLAGVSTYASVQSALAGYLLTAKTCAGSSCWIASGMPDMPAGLPAAPTLSLLINGQSSSDVSTAVGASYAVSWTSSGATNCWLHRMSPNNPATTTVGTCGAAGWCGTSHSISDNPLVAGEHRYMLACVGPGGTVSSDRRHRITVH